MLRYVKGEAVQQLHFQLKVSRRENFHIRQLE